MARRWMFVGVVAVFALALSARLYYLHEIRASPLFTAPVVDARTYTEEARYLSDVSFAGRPAPFWQPPLYPVLLGGLFALAGDDLYLPRLIQAFIGALVCVLICLLGHRIFGAGVGLGAGFAAALYGPLIYFGGELLPTLLACCLNLLVLLLAIGEGGWARWLAAGVLLGLSALAVANVLLFAPALLGYLYWRQRRLRPAAFLLLGCALVIAPVAYRNWAVGGDLVLISHNAGINFYIGNNPDYEQTTHIRPGRDWIELVEMPERRAGIDQPSAKSRYFFAQSWQYITSEPLDFLGLLAYKGYLFLRGDEIPRNRDLYFSRNDSSLLSILLWKKGLAFPFGLVLPLALLGFYVFLRSPKPPEGRLLALFVACYALSVVLFFVTARYRLPAVPVLLLFAAYGVRFLWHRPWPALPALAALLIFCNVAAGAMDQEGNAHEHYYLGYAYEKRDMPAHAARHYRHAIARDPNFAEPLLALAALHGEAERYSKAIDLYRRYLKTQPNDVDVRFLLGHTALLARRYDEAAAAYSEVAAARPNWAAAHGGLGYALLMTDQPQRAARAYSRTLELNPDSTLVRYQLARLYAAQGQHREAIAEFEQLMQREPHVPEYPTRLADLLIQLEQGIGMTLRQTDRLAEAEKLLRHAIALDSKAAHPHWSLGMLCARQGRYAEAVPLFEHLLQIAPRDYQAHLFLGHLYQRTGRQADADAQFAAFSRSQRAHRMEKVARREIETQIEQIFGG
ncbi:MAG: tetratricopeptide repeat protein [Gemmatimonadota bacterium]|nr:tetratricopeptide repeat protein [Gemmatimonadota bacterium]